MYHMEPGSNTRPGSQHRTVKLLEKLGYRYVPRAQAEILRGSLKNVLFPDVLLEFLQRQSFYYRGKRMPFSLRSLGKAQKDLDVSLVSGTRAASKHIFDMLIFGNSYEEELLDGGRESFDLRFIDWEHPENNIWQVTDEFLVERTNLKYVLADVVLLVNGIPLAVIECKKSAQLLDEGIEHHLRSCQPDYIPQLYKFIQLVLALRSDVVKYGTSGTPAEYFNIWREKDHGWHQEKTQKASPDGRILPQDQAVVSLLSKERLLELIRHFIIYDNNVKKIAHYQQFFAVQAAVQRIKAQDDAGTKNGVIWHTQGSGKSLTMVMLVKKLLADPDLNNPRFVLVNDRINLDKQLRDNFAKTQLSPTRATTGKGLINLLNNQSEIIITTLVHKFDNAAKSRYKIIDDNIILLVDESHRSQSGTLHNYMNHVLPNALKIGFTGTPLLKKDKSNTYRRFGPLIDSYSTAQAVEDGVIVPLIYEGRVIPQEVVKEKLDAYLKYIMLPLNGQQQAEIQRKWSRFSALAQTDQRLAMIAFDIHTHFLQFTKPKGFKAMVAASSRTAAIDLHNNLKRLGQIRSAVIISPDNGKEGEELSQDHKMKIKTFFQEEVEPVYGSNYEKYQDQMKNSFVSGEEIDILIVNNMLLTGFDAPRAAVIYVDKPMQEHTLLQAIARINRLYPGKDYGLVVDYWGLFNNLQTALDIYNDEKSGLSGYDPGDIQNAIFGAEDQKQNIEIAHQNLWNLFNTGVQTLNLEEWQEKLEDSELRRNFLDRLSVFTRLIGLALDSYDLYQLIGFEPMEKYKQDIRCFQKLRGEILLRYNERIDYRKYDRGIRALLNNYILAQPSQIITEPVPITDREGMYKQLSSLSSDAARGDAIRTRIAVELETYRYDDPLLFKDFSGQVQERLTEYRSSRNDEAYLSAMEKIAENYKNRALAYEYPQGIEYDQDAKAFYGVVLHVVGGPMEKEIRPELDEALGVLAIGIKNAIAQRTKVDWRFNVAVRKDMEQALDDLIWDFSEEHNLELTVEKIDLILEGVIKIALSRY